MPDQFKPGDVVRLKSSGRKMTVVEYGEYEDGRRCLCKWFDSAKVVADTFVDAELDHLGS